MVWRASQWARPLQAGGAARKAVLLCLAEACDRWGFAMESATDIAADAEVSLRQVYRIMKELADAGLITIFQARYQGRSQNLYRLNFDPEPKEPIPLEHPSLSERYKHHRGVEGLGNAIAQLAQAPGDILSPGPRDNMSPGPRDNMSPGPGDISSNPGCQMERSRVTPVSPNLRTNESSGETRARAREAAAPDGAASPDAAPGENQTPDRSASEDGAEGGDTPANAHWNAKMPELERYFASELNMFRHWMLDCTPDSDDGETLVLAVPSGLTEDYVTNHYLRGLAKVLGRRIEFIQTEWAAKRRGVRLAEAKARREAGRKRGAA